MWRAQNAEILEYKGCNFVCVAGNERKNPFSRKKK